MTDPGSRSTTATTYTKRLLREETTWWKRAIDVRGLYGWNLRRLRPGFVLDVGCGLGRNLAHLHGEGVGVDHNVTSVEVCRSRGLTAYTPAEFLASADASRRYDTLLFAHVVEHMSFDEAKQLITEYVPHLTPHGRVILITPQEYGFRADPTHVEFFDHANHRRLLEAVGAKIERQSSFPLPHAVFGRIFRHNEFLSVGRF